MNTVLLGCCFVAFALATILAAPIGQSQPIEGHGRNPRTEDDVRSYLIQFGHWQQSSVRSNGIENEADLKNSLRAYQRHFGLNITGVADNATLELMATPRCGLSDTISTGRQKRYALLGTKWPRTKLTYLFQNYYSDLPVNVTRSLIQRSLKDWSDVSPLSFTESRSRSASLKLLFARLDHGDGDPFDGPEGVLAHASPPTEGDIHFDADERWTNSSHDVNLRQVSTHEIGHAIGLGHSRDKNAVMYAYFSYNKNFALHRDDIRGIQRLYGKPTKPANSFASPLRPTPSYIKISPVATIPPASPSVGSQSSRQTRRNN